MKKARVMVVGAQSEAISAIAEPARKPIISYFNRDLHSHVRYQIIPCVALDKARKIFFDLNPDIIAISSEFENAEIFKLVKHIRCRQGVRHPGVVIFSRSARYDQLALEQLIDCGVDDVFDQDVGPEEVYIRLSTLYRFKLATDELRQANHCLEKMTLTDDLTQLHNMRSFNRQFKDLMQSCRHGDFDVGVIMMDLDYFKMVNDRTNHLVGSYVISQVGELISRYLNIPNLGFAARFGGDEFVVAAAFQELKELKNLAKSLHEIIARAVFKKDGFVIRVTASIGYAWIDKGFKGSEEDPVKAADAMLYRSKRLGRDKVSGMILRYPIDFNHVGRAHLIDGNTSSYHDHVSGFN